MGVEAPPRAKWIRTLLFELGRIANVILFLASPMADYLNGVTIDINGGSWFQ